MVGEGNGTPLQYSCLENPKDRGAWQAAVRGVAKSRTRLSDFTFTFTFTFRYWRRKWQPTPVFLPGESQGRGSLVGCCLWGRTESDTTEATQQQQQQQQQGMVVETHCHFNLYFSDFYNVKHFAYAYQLVIYLSFINSKGFYPFLLDYFLLLIMNSYLHGLNISFLSLYTHIYMYYKYFLQVYSQGEVFNFNKVQFILIFPFIESLTLPSILIKISFIFLLLYLCL